MASNICVKIDRILNSHGRVISLIALVGICLCIYIISKYQPKSKHQARVFEEIDLPKEALQAPKRKKNFFPSWWEHELISQKDAEADGDAVIYDGPPDPNYDYEDVKPKFKGKPKIKSSEENEVADFMAKPQNGDDSVQGMLGVAHAQPDVQHQPNAFGLPFHNSKK